MADWSSSRRRSRNAVLTAARRAAWRPHSRHQRCRGVYAAVDGLTHLDLSQTSRLDEPGGPRSNLVLIAISASSPRVSLASLPSLSGSRPAAGGAQDVRTRPQRGHESQRARTRPGSKAASSEALAVSSELSKASRAAASGSRVAWLAGRWSANIDLAASMPWSAHISGLDQCVDTISAAESAPATALSVRPRQLDTISTFWLQTR